MSPVQTRRSVNILGGVAFALIALAPGDLPEQTATEVQQRGAPALNHMSIQATVYPQEGRLSAECTLRITNTTAAPLDRITILLNKGLTALEVRDSSQHRLELRQQVRPFEDFSALEVMVVSVALTRPMEPGSSRSVTLRYAGVVTPYTQTGMQYVQDTITSEYALLRADAFSIPVLSAPAISSLRATSSTRFTAESEVRVPVGYTAATGGTWISREDSAGWTTWRYRAAIAPYLVIAVARFSTIRQSGLTVFHLPQDSAGARYLMGRALTALDHLRAWYGPLPDSAQLAIMEIPDGWGSQASLTGGIIQTAAAFRDPAHLREVYHELTHLWNAPDMDLPSARWNEGLATFLSYRLAAEIDRAELASAMDSVVQRTGRRLNAEPRLREVPFKQYGAQSMTDYSYSVGALLFSLLHDLMGASDFDARYRKLFAEHWKSGVTLGDLERAFSGHEVTDLVFREWVHTTEWTTRVSAVRAYGELQRSFARPGGDDPY